MANPPSDKTVINVKGVSRKSWENAKKLGVKHDEPMGSVLSRAIDQMVKIDTGQRELAPPGLEVNPPPIPPNISPDSLATLMHAMAALASTTSIQPPARAVRRAYRLSDALIRQAAGDPPARRRTPTLPGKENGQSFEITRQPETRLPGETA